MEKWGVGGEVSLCAFQKVWYINLYDFLHDEKRLLCVEAFWIISDSYLSRELENSYLVPVCIQPQKKLLLVDEVYAGKKSVLHYYRIANLDMKIGREKDTWDWWIVQRERDNEYEIKRGGRGR